MERAVSDAGAVGKPAFKEVRSTTVWSERRLRQAWELRGGHPSNYRCPEAYAEVRDWRYVQAIALGHADAAKHLSIGEGPETCLKVVGWARAKVQDALDGPAFVDVEGVFVDPTVERPPVEAFLLRRLQEKVGRARNCYKALRVDVPGDDPGAAALHWGLGFRESGRGDEFVWYPA